MPRKKAAAKKEDSPKKKVPIVSVIAHKARTATEYNRKKGYQLQRAAFSRVVHKTLETSENVNAGDITRISPAAILALQRYAEQSVGTHIHSASHMAYEMGNTRTLTAAHLNAVTAAFNVTSGAKINALGI